MSSWPLNWVHWVMKDKCSWCSYCCQLCYLFTLLNELVGFPCAQHCILHCVIGYILFRFYLGHWQEGIGKLFSFGGLGVWTLIDVILISLHYLGPADGSLYIWVWNLMFLVKYAGICVNHINWFLIQLRNHLNNKVSNEFIHKQYVKTVWIFVTVPIVTFAIKSSSSSVSDNGNIRLRLCDNK